MHQFSTQNSSLLCALNCCKAEIYLVEKKEVPYNSSHTEGIWVNRWSSELLKGGYRKQKEPAKSSDPLNPQWLQNVQKNILSNFMFFFHVDKIKILGIRIDMKEIREVVLCIKARSVQILSICLKANYATHLPATPAQWWKRQEDSFGFLTFTLVLGSVKDLID